MYVGSVEALRENMWVYDEGLKKMVMREVDYVPGLHKIYDEILVNAADNKVRDPSQRFIKVDIDQKKNKISITNDGLGIPIEYHKEHNIYVPELIFGHMMTSSNYDDTSKNIVGGRFGFGAKLCNILSKEFTVETASSDKRKKLVQTWRDNMQIKDSVQITDYKGKDYTKITYTPDLKRLGVKTLTDDIVAVFKKRAYDVAGTTKGITVYLNGEKIPIDPKQPFKSYCELYLQDSSQLVYTIPDNSESKGRWEIGFAMSNHGFQQTSFVNSIGTKKGGQHINVVLDQLIKQIEVKVNKKKNDIKVKYLKLIYTTLSHAG